MSPMTFATALDHARAFKARMVTPFEHLEAVLAAAVVADVAVKAAQATVDQLTQEAETLRAHVAKETAAAAEHLDATRSQAQAAEAALAAHLAEVRRETEATLTTLAADVTKAHVAHDATIAELSASEKMANDDFARVEAKLAAANMQLTGLRERLG